MSKPPISVPAARVVQVSAGRSEPPRQVRGQVTLTGRRPAAVVTVPEPAPVAPAVSAAPAPETAPAAPVHPLVHKANQWVARGQFAKAEQLLLEVLAEQPESVPVRRNLAMVYLMQGRYKDASPLFKALAPLCPTDENLWVNHAISLFKLEHMHEARLVLEDVLRRFPRNASARVSLASIFLNNLRQPHEALSVLQPALPAAEADASVQFAFGCVHGALGHFEQAVDHYSRALDAQPGHVESLSNLLFTLHYLNPVDLARVREVSLRHGQWLQQDAQRKGWLPDRAPAASGRPGQRLRIGMLSGDLRDHPVGYFLGSVVNALRHREVELFAYANHGQTAQVPEALKAGFSAWREIGALSDQQAAEQIAADRLDVLLDLSGHTTGHRLAVLLRRPAPRQVSWLGYFGTTGLPCIDAVIADPHCVPTDEARHFSERLLYMPHSRLCLTPPTDAPDVAPEPPMASLPFITWGCFQNVNKINDGVLRLWRRILEAVPDSVLRLQNGRFEQTWQVLRMRERMRAVGIDLRRVWMSSNLPREHYLGQYAEIDVLLDTFPYPGGTTTAEALWMGVPTLTLATPGMLGRQGQAMLENVGLADWVAHSEDDAVAKAVALARDRAAAVARLRQLRRDLRETARRSPLFDAETFAADLERLLRQFCSE